MRRLAATTAARFLLGCGGATSDPPVAAANERKMPLLLCRCHPPPRELGGETPVLLHPCHGQSAQRSADRSTRLALGCPTPCFELPGILLVMRIWRLTRRPGRSAPASLSRVIRNAGTLWTFPTEPSQLSPSHA